MDMWPIVELINGVLGLASGRDTPAYREKAAQQEHAIYQRCEALDTPERRLKFCGVTQPGKAECIGQIKCGTGQYWLWLRDGYE